MESINRLIMLGKEQLNRGNYNNALNFFEQAILLDQKDPDLWNLKGITLRSLGRYDEAISCFNKSLNIDPRDKNKTSYAMKLMILCIPLIQSGLTD